MCRPPRGNEGTAPLTDLQSTGDTLEILEELIYHPELEKKKDRNEH